MSVTTNIAKNAATTKHRRTLSILVENEPGVLSRVVAMFTRRSFNIHSLAVGETETEAISRITVQVDTTQLSFEQITKQLNKLVHVLKVAEIEPENAIVRKFVLFKVECSEKTRGEILQIVELFRAHVVDVHPTSIVVEASGEQDKLEALLNMLLPYGVNEIVQSGAVAITRGPKSMTDQLKGDK